MYRHRIYLSSMTIGHLIEFAKRFPHIKLNVLLSYALLDNNINGFLKIHRGLIQGLILDSGVFSLKALALKMTPDELFLKFRTYCSYSHKSWGLVFNFDRYFRLDSYDKNLAYQIDLEKAGIPVVPVIHNIYNNDVDKIIARGLPEHRTVAIGQCTGRTTLKNIRPAVMKLYDAGAQVHFFGSSEFRVMAQLPITSCDSTSWCKYVGLGIVLYWNPKKSGFDKTDLPAKSPLKQLVATA